MHTNSARSVVSYVLSARRGLRGSRPDSWSHNSVSLSLNALHPEAAAAAHDPAGAIGAPGQGDFRGNREITWGLRLCDTCQHGGASQLHCLSYSTVRLNVVECVAVPLVAVSVTL